MLANICKQETSATIRHLGIPLIANLGKYFGMSTIHRRVNGNIFKYVLDWV